MNDIKNSLHNLLSELKKERDELQVRLCLAKMEVGDEWEKLEAKIEKLDARVNEIGRATGEASQEIGVAARLLGAEIREGFKKIASKF
jgi:hypothetical protein